MIPAVPGTMSTGRDQAEARRNVVDALGVMLSVEPDKLPEGAKTERVALSLELERRQTRDLGVDR
jgi:predicted RNase H-like HicB family nuclease